VQQPDVRVVRATESGGVAGHGLKHRLQIGRRAGDDPQDLTRGRLLLERLGQLAVATLQLLKEPRVLDRDHRLVRERLEQLDLAVGERADLVAQNDDRPDRFALAHQGRGQHGPRVGRQLLARGELMPHGPHVEEMVRLPVDHSPSSQRAAVDRKLHPDDLAGSPVAGHRAEGTIHYSIHPCVACLAETRRALGDGVQHRPQVGRRGGDHP
jgi:hypothetical protein